MALTQANTYPTQGIMTTQMLSMYDVLKPQHVPEVIARFGPQFFPFFNWLAAMGREEPISGNSWFGHEENRYHKAFKVKTTVGDPGANNPSLVTLGYSGAGDLDSNNAFYPREGDIITVPGTEVQGRINSIDVTTPSAPVLSIYPTKLGTTIGELTAGTTVIITSGSFADGTGQPAGTRVGLTKREFYLQIIKETINIEGGALADELWYKVIDNNKNVIGWYSPGYGRCDYLMALKADGALFIGDETTNTDSSFVVPAGSPGAGNRPYTTKGAVPWIRELGWAKPVTPGSFTFTDLDDIALYQRQQGVGSGLNMWLQGPRLANDVENAMKTYLQNTGVDYTRVIQQMFGNIPEAQQLAVSLNFGVITKGQMTFVAKVMDQWINPELYGASGYDFDQYGIVMPVSTLKDPKNGKKLDNIALRYKALNGYSRRFEVWTVAGAGGGLYVTDIDSKNTYMRSHIGLQLFKANQMVLNDPT